MKTTSLLNRKYHCQLIGFCTQQHNFTAHLGRRCTMKCTWVWWLEPSGLPPEPWRSAQCILKVWRGLLDDYASMFPSWNSVQKFCDELLKLDNTRRARWPEDLLCSLDPFLDQFDRVYYSWTCGFLGPNLENLPLFDHSDRVYYSWTCGFLGPELGESPTFWSLW